MSTYTALCVGGPLDGQWRTVEDRTFEVAELPKLTFSTENTDAVIEPFARHRYHVDSIAMFGFHTYVAVCEKQFMGSSERNKAVLRALLQRDVAAQMGVL
jgi:hypothetical protein